VPFFRVETIHQKYLCPLCAVPLGCLVVCLWAASPLVGGACGKPPFICSIERCLGCLFDFFLSLSSKIPSLSSCQDSIANRGNLVIDTCGTNCAADTCTGLNECSSCVDGYKGANCESKCPFGTYGPACGVSCSLKI
jgi:hypothetical protein